MKKNQDAQEPPKRARTPPSGVSFFDDPFGFFGTTLATFLPTSSSSSPATTPPSPASESPATTPSPQSDSSGPSSNTMIPGRVSVSAPTSRSPTPLQPLELFHPFHSQPTTPVRTGQSNAGPRQPLHTPILSRANSHQLALAAESVDTTEQTQFPMFILVSPGESITETKDSIYSGLTLIYQIIISQEECIFPETRTFAFKITVNMRHDVSHDDLQKMRPLLQNPSFIFTHFYDHFLSILIINHQTKEQVYGENTLITLTLSKAGEHIYGNLSTSNLRSSTILLEENLNNTLYINVLPPTNNIPRILLRNKWIIKLENYLGTHNSLIDDKTKLYAMQSVLSYLRNSLFVDIINNTHSDNNNASVISNIDFNLSSKSNIHVSYNDKTMTAPNICVITQDSAPIIIEPTYMTIFLTTEKSSSYRELYDLTIFAEITNALIHNVQAQINSNRSSQEPASASTSYPSELLMASVEPKALIIKRMENNITAYETLESTLINVIQSVFLDDADINDRCYTENENTFNMVQREREDIIHCINAYNETDSIKSQDDVQVMINKNAYVDRLSNLTLSIEQSLSFMKAMIAMDEKNRNHLSIFFLTQGNLTFELYYPRLLGKLVQNHNTCDGFIDINPVMARFSTNTYHFMSHPGLSAETYILSDNDMSSILMTVHEISILLDYAVKHTNDVIKTIITEYRSGRATNPIQSSSHNSTSHHVNYSWTNRLLIMSSTLDKIIALLEKSRHHKVIVYPKTQTPLSADIIIANLKTVSELAKALDQLFFNVTNLIEPIEAIQASKAHPMLSSNRYDTLIYHKIMTQLTQIVREDQLPLLLGQPDDLMSDPIDQSVTVDACYHAMHTLLRVHYGLAVEPTERAGHYRLTQQSPDYNQLLSADLSNTQSSAVFQATTTGNAFFSLFSRALITAASQQTPIAASSSPIDISDPTTSANTALSQQYASICTYLSQIAQGTVADLDRGLLHLDSEESCQIIEVTHRLIATMLMLHFSTDEKQASTTQSNLITFLKHIQKMALAIERIWNNILREANNLYGQDIAPIVISTIGQALCTIVTMPLLLALFKRSVKTYEPTFVRLIDAAMTSIDGIYHEWRNDLSINHYEFGGKSRSLIELFSNLLNSERHLFQSTNNISTIQNDFILCLSGYVNLAKLFSRNTEAFNQLLEKAAIPHKKIVNALTIGITPLFTNFYQVSLQYYLKEMHNKYHVKFNEMSLTKALDAFIGILVPIKKLYAELMLIEQENPALCSYQPFSGQVRLSLMRIAQSLVSSKECQHLNGGFYILLWTLGCTKDLEDANIPFQLTPFSLPDVPNNDSLFSFGKPSPAQLQQAVITHLGTNAYHLGLSEELHKLMIRQYLLRTKRWQNQFVEGSAHDTNSPLQRTVSLLDIPATSPHPNMLHRAPSLQNTATPSTSQRTRASSELDLRLSSSSQPAVRHSVRESSYIGSSSAFPFSTASYSSSQDGSATAPIPRRKAPSPGPSK